MLKYNTSVVTRIIIALSLGLIACSSIAPAAVLEDNFDDGTTAGFPSPNVGGSTLTNPGSGGNPNGYLRVARDSANPSVYLAHPKYSGNWGTMIGSNGIVMSFDIRVEDIGNIETLRMEISNPNFSDIWRKDLFSGGAFPIESNDGWVHFEYPIDVTWTDLDANAAGWNRVFPSGTPQSWAQVLANVRGSLTGATFIGNAFIGEGATQVVSFDNFRLAPIPEPSAVGLLLAGCLLGTRRRR